MVADLPSDWPTVRVLVAAEESEWASGELWNVGSTGVAEHPQDDGTVLLVSGFPTETDAAEAAASLPSAWSPEVHLVHGADWLDSWREHFLVTRIGRFVLVPAWKDMSKDPTLSALNEDDVVLHIDPGRAFGTGAHPSTALCLEELAGLVKPGMSVLDVGCGSGVLSVAAAKLGASRVLGIDVESEAVRVTLANAERCGVRHQVDAALTPVADVTGPHALVLANILSPVLLALADEIVPHVAPGGYLVIAGIINSQIADILRAYEVLEPLRVGEHGIWRSVVLQRTLLT